MVLSSVASGFAALFVGLYLYTALSRIAFPFDLEWGEGAFVDHVLRLVRHQPLYVQPSLDFTPLIYTPGYYYLAAAVSVFFGVSIVTLRAVSIACSVALLAVLAAFGHRERGSVFDGLRLAGLFAATYAIGGAWLDIARADALLLLLLVSAMYVLRFGESAAAMVAGGLLLAGAVLTKQVALTLAPPLLVYAICRKGRRGALAAAAFLAGTGVLVALLQWRSDGWFLYYVFYALTKTQSVWSERPLAFLTTDLFGALPIATGLGLAWCAVAWRVSHWDDWLFYVLVGGGILVSTWETRVHPGAWFNTLLPAYAFLAIAATRMAALLDRRAPGLGSALIVAQLTLLIYNPHRYVPAAADHAAVHQMVDVLRRVPGDVLMLDHGYFPTLAGKRTHAHEMAIRDVLSTGDHWADELLRDMRTALDEQRFDLVVQDSPDWFPLPLSVYYRGTDRLWHSGQALRAVVGNPIGPELVYLPRHRAVKWPPDADVRH